MTNQAAQTMPTVPQAFFDEFGVNADDRVMDYGRACYAAALSQTAGVPDGWKLVPVEPTDEMIDAAWECDSATDYVGEHKRIHSAADAYRAMLAAAPDASGVHPDALPDGTLSKSTAKRVEALASASVGRMTMAEYTTGHCPNHNQPGGCQLHNLQCGWPNCDRRQVQHQPQAAASVSEEEGE